MISRSDYILSQQTKHVGHSVHVRLQGSLQSRKNLKPVAQFVSQKTVHSSFGHNLDICRPIFLIRSLADSQRIFGTDFHLTITALLHYLVKFKNSK